jgi:hypothetical protein
MWVQLVWKGVATHAWRLGSSRGPVEGDTDILVKSQSNEKCDINERRYWIVLQQVTFPLALQVMVAAL